MVLEEDFQFNQIHARKHGDFIIRTNEDSSTSAMRRWLEQPPDDDSSPQYRFAVSECVFSKNIRTIHDLDLSPGSLRMLHTPNAGGSSLASEVMSLEPVTTLVNVELAKTETEIGYASPGSITDYACKMANHVVGVSVTRCFSWKGDPLRKNDAKKLLEKKLKGVIASTANQLDEPKWQRQILHVWVRTRSDCAALRQAFDSIDESLKANTFVLVTICDAHFIYFDRTKAELEKAIAAKGKTKITSPPLLPCSIEPGPSSHETIEV